ncbi:hypothetical protein Lal_00024302 [Lupinus albus]|nr:hypothetical protein Lal_00024302 [Lupinus albus]
MGDYSIHHQFGSSSQYQGTLPPYNAFGTTSTTPLLAFHSKQYYQPTMPSQGNFLGDEDYEDDDDEYEEEEDEEMPQLVRGGSGQSRQRQQQQQQQQQLRVQPPRRRKSPSCDTSSHRRH